MSKTDPYFLMGARKGASAYRNLGVSNRYPSTRDVKMFELMDKGERYRDLAAIRGDDRLDQFGEGYLRGIMEAYGKSCASPCEGSISTPLPRCLSRV